MTRPGVTSWSEDRCRALEDGLQWLIRSQDAGPEPGIRSFGPLAWSVPDVVGSGQASSVLATYGKSSDDPAYLERAHRMATWTADQLVTETRLSPSDRTRAAAGVLEVACSCEDDALRARVNESLASDGPEVLGSHSVALVADAERAWLVAKSSIDSTSSGRAAPLMRLLLEIAGASTTVPPLASPTDEGRMAADTRSIVAAASVLCSSTPEGPADELLAAALRMAGWMIDRLEVNRVLTAAYPMKTPGARSWAPSETLCSAATLWLALYERTCDAWYLNAALHLIDVVRSSQHAGLARADCYGSVPAFARAAARDRQPSTGDGLATAAFLSAVLAEQRAVAFNTMTNWQRPLSDRTS